MMSDDDIGMAFIMDCAGGSECNPKIFSSRYREDLMNLSGDTGGRQIIASHTGDLLLVAFIVMKLTGVIDWSWWWVLAPLWIPLALCAIMIIVVTWVTS